MLFTVLLQYKKQPQNFTGFTNENLKKASEICGKYVGKLFQWHNFRNIKQQYIYLKLSLFF
jgi:hypothetical protein